MNWTLDEPKFGDIIRVKLGGIYHFGIYASDDEVLQFGLPPTRLDRDASTVKVLATGIETFLCDKFLEVGVPDKHEKKKIRTPEEIVKTARARLGEGGYHILYNNCEHFVNQCAFGETTCSQVDDIRKMWQNFNLIDVYVKKFPFDADKNIYPNEREEEIESCNNKDVQTEKFYAWKLLEYALKKSLNKDIKGIKFEKIGSKWTCDACEFSISHSGDLVAVVISKKPVGIDIELIDDRFKNIPKERVLTNEEIDKFKNADEVKLNEIWTVKEAVFKKYSGQTFNPTKVNILGEKYSTKKLVYGEKEYFLTLASNDCLFAKYHIDENLELKNK